MLLVVAVVVVVVVAEVVVAVDGVVVVVVVVAVDEVVVVVVDEAMVAAVDEVVVVVVDEVVAMTGQSAQIGSSENGKPSTAEHTIENEIPITDRAATAEEIKAATKLQALQRGKHLRNDMKAGRGKFTGRGGVEEDVEVDAVAVEVDVEVVDEVPQRGRGGAGRGMPGRGMPGRGRGVLDVVCRGEVCRAGPWGCWTWYATWGAGAPRGLPNRRGAPGALLVGVCLEGYPNQKYSWCSQLQNQRRISACRTSEATPIVVSKDAPEEAEKGTSGEAPKPIPTGGERCSRRFSR